MIAATLSFYIYQSSSTLYFEAEASITQLQKKRKAVTGMMRAARERSVLLLNMYIEQDVFARDAMKMQLTNLAHHFNESKSDFENADLSVEEKTVFDEVMTMVKANAPVHLHAADKMINDEMKEANVLLFDEVIPRQQQVLEKFDYILSLIDTSVNEKIQSLKTLQYRTNQYILQLIFLMLTGISILFFISYSRSVRRESELKKLVAERTQNLQQAHNQVQSLIENSSDAIISIDENQCIVIFNHAAEKIFQYTNSEAIGKPLSILLPEEVHAIHSGYVANFGKDKHTEARMMQSREEIKGRRKDGSLFDAEASISKASINGACYFTAFLRDITKRKQAEEKIRYLAMHDSLTGLANRHHFESVLKKAIALTARYSEDKFSLLFLDLDLFKEVNDSYGHAIGDKLLVKIAEILQETVRDTDTIARIGGDEFAIILHGIDTTEDASLIAEKLINGVSAEQKIDGYKVRIGVSIGITFCPKYTSQCEQLLKQADMMLYKSKESGRNTYSIYLEEESSTK